MNENHANSNSGELNEARLTAYALDQLHGQERAAVEAQLAALDQEAADRFRRAVEQVRALAGHVSEAARQDPLPQPSPGLRAAVERHLSQWEDSPMATTQDPSSHKPRPWYRRHWLLLAAAACLLIAAVPLGLFIAGHAQHRHAQQVAIAERQLALHDGAGAISLPSETAATQVTGEELAEARIDDVALEVVRGSRSRSGVEQGQHALSEHMYSAEDTTAGGKSQVGDGPYGMPGASPASGSGQGADPAAAYVHEEYRGGMGAPGGMPRSAMGADERSAAAMDGMGAQYPGMMSGTGQPRRGGRPGGDAAAGSQQPGGFWGQLDTPLKEDSFGSAAPQSGGLPGLKEGAAPDGPGGATTFAVDGSTRLVPEGQQYDAYGRVRTGDEWRSRTRVLPGGQYQPGNRRGVPGTEQYDAIAENEFLPAGAQPLSTFSIDVDTASYANVRRFLNDGRLPPHSAVRIEEMINYFRYDYPQPDDEVPFSVNMEVAQCPWNGEHRLLRIGLKGRQIERDQRGPSNLVFLLDVSGSMADQNKLPLVKQAMRLLVDQLTEDDRVAIVTYASSAGRRLESTCASDKQKILDAIDALSAGGSTHGSAGIQMAYQEAGQHFVEGGTNRVILATDGDLNVGITDDDELVKLIRKKAKSGVFLTVLGFGTGNLKDAKMEKLADNGNGTYAYVDNLREARKVLVEQISGSLVTIAKDVKIQMEFNPAEVSAYRLVGYENRLLAARDFDNDKKDAGEIGAGHTVTALYELVPAGQERAATAGRPLKYQRVAEDQQGELTEAAQGGELLTLWLRYKEPEGNQSKLLEFVVADSGKRFGEASPDFQFAAAVASFGMVLRGSRYAGSLTLAAVEEFAVSGVGNDPGGYRAEFVDLVRRCREIVHR